MFRKPPQALQPRLKRVVVFVGYACMNDCLFCVVADKRKYGDKTTLEIKKELVEAYEGGARELVFSGGECGARKDIVALVAFARTLGFLGVHLQTNGRVFSSMDFCKKILRAGMTVFNPALHGHTAALHDQLTRSPGAFRQTVLGIYNVRKLSQGAIWIATNTVVVKQNFRHLPDIASLLISLRVPQIQFAFVHAMGHAQSFFETVVPRKTDVVPYLKQALDLGRHRGVQMMAEAIPLCLMQGYEECCTEFYIPSIEVRERGQIIPRFEDVRIHEAKIKFPQCERCTNNSLCEGPWKEYPEYYGSEEFQPVGS